MAFYVDPKGVINVALARHFGHPDNTKWIIGTEGDDTFVFTKDIGPHVVLGRGGNDTFNQAALPIEEPLAAYYGGLNDIKNASVMQFPFPFTPWKGGQTDTFHVGGSAIVKAGLGADKTVLHGGHYKNPAKVFVQTHEKDRVYLAGDVEDVIRFKTVATKADSDGKGYTSRMYSITVKGDNPKNFISDDQLVELVLSDDGGHYTSPKVNTYKATWIDHDRPSITEADVQHFVDHWDVLL